MVSAGYNLVWTQNYVLDGAGVGPEAGEESVI